MTEQLVLPEVMRRESRSYLQYIREAFPKANGKDTSIRDAVLRMANAEAEIIAKIGRVLQKRRIPMPGLSAFPTSFTGSNFLSASALLPRLVAGQRQTIADLERDQSATLDDETRSLLDAFHDLKRSNLAELELLSGTSTAVA